MFNILTPITLSVILLVSFICNFLLLGFLLGKKRTDSSTALFDDLYLKIKDDIKYAVAPKSIQITTELGSLVELAVEVWRIEQRINKSIGTLSDNNKKALDSSVQKLKDHLEKYDTEIIDHTSQPYNDGLNLDVLGIEKDPSLRAPIIKETIEPTIICRGQVVKKAKIIIVTN
jgi:hypothetical protein